MATFTPNEHITKIQGRDYLEVKWRIVWFRHENPTGSIQVNHTPVGDSLIIVKASVLNNDGTHLADGSATVRKAEGHEQRTWGGREIEKAETAAIGRALAHAGYGTQFTGEDEGDNLADSPVQRNGNNRRQPQPRQQQQNSNRKQPDGNGSNGNIFEENARRAKVFNALPAGTFDNMTAMMKWSDENNIDWKVQNSETILGIIGEQMNIAIEGIG